MRKLSPHRFTSYELPTLLTLVAVVSLCLPTPQSTAQGNRQLNRDQAPQANRASERRIALIVGNGDYTNAPLSSRRCDHRNGEVLITPQCDL